MSLKYEPASVTTTQRFSAVPGHVGTPFLRTMEGPTKREEALRGNRFRVVYQPTQSRISPSILWYKKTKVYLVICDSGSVPPESKTIKLEPRVAPRQSVGRGDRLRVGRGTTRAEDAQGTPTQSHISSSILVYEDNRCWQRL